MRSTECPECRWMPVVDGSGRRRLEMRWELPVAAPATTSLVPATTAPARAA